MKKLLLILLVLISVSSCKIYTYPPKPEIKSLLAVTSQGDTIQVSTDYLQREFEVNPGRYSNWRFNWDNNWYYGYGWYNYYDPYWMYRIPYRNRIIVQPRPKVSTPRYVPRHFDNRPSPPIRREPVVPPSRGRSNVQPRQPQVQQPKQSQGPRQVPQQSPRVQPKPQPNRGAGNVRTPNVVKTHDF